MNPEKNDQLASQPSIESLKAKLELSANRRAESSLNYCTETKKDIATFASEAMEEPFNITIDINDPESITLGIFEVQRKMGFPLDTSRIGCDGILGPYTYAQFEAARTRYRDTLNRNELLQFVLQNNPSVAVTAPANTPATAPTIKTQSAPTEEIKVAGETLNETPFERREFKDAVTGYTIAVFVPQGADGSTEVLFTGSDETVEETLDHMQIPGYLQKLWKTGVRTSYAIVVGKDTGHSKDKYIALKNKKNPLTSILNGIATTCGVNDSTKPVKIGAWSRGGEAMRHLVASGDPAMSRVVALNNYDNSYHSMGILAQYAKDNPKCQINFAYQNAEGNGTREFGKEFEQLTAGMLNVKVVATKGLMHIDIAREYQEQFAGLPSKNNENVG